MGSTTSRISEDIEDYKRLCHQYGEQPDRGAWGPDPYGDHGRMLRERRRQEDPTDTTWASVEPRWSVGEINAALKARRALHGR